MSHRAAEAGPSRMGPMKASPATEHSDAEEEDGLQGSGSELEGESESASTGQEYHDALPTRPDVKGKAPAFAYRRAPATPPVSTTKKSGFWTDLDLSIIVALVSPIGNWLTGGDHIKNLFLIILLIFYLHQIIEIPWQLYLAARPRKLEHRVATSPTGDDARAAHLTSLAEGELQRSEIFYLVLSIVSPFIGAIFLRYVLNALGDTNSLTWFSTTLFVLATGIRPWSHLINRLRDRTHELHTALHFPDEESLVHMYEQSERKLRSTLRRVDTLERELLNLRDTVKRLEQLREVCDDLTEILGDVERAAKRSERKADASRAAQSVRITGVEQGLVQLEERRKRDNAAIEAAGIRIPKSDVLFQQARSSVATLFDKLLYIPRAILLLGLEDPLALHEHKEFHINIPTNGLSSGNDNGHSNGSGDGSTNGNGTSSLQSRVVRSPDREKHLPHLVPRLATIPEAEDSDSDGTEGTFVSDDREGPGPSTPGTPGAPSPRTVLARSKSVSSATSDRTRVGDGNVHATAYDRVQTAVLWPYRFSVRILVMVLPPAKQFVPRL
ncbi:hypothetical protein C8Q74DRAFT_1308698 [Fomes fomentarius]|nr:hypothetical protein C8Q74DRAFT_1308698 [Fomes fomentarius]